MSLPLLDLDRATRIQQQLLTLLAPEGSSAIGEIQQVIYPGFYASGPTSLPRQFGKSTDMYKILRDGIKEAKMERAPKFRQYFMSTHSVHMLLDAYWLFFLGEFVDIDVNFLFEESNNLLKLRHNGRTTPGSRSRTPQQLPVGGMAVAHPPNLSDAADVDSEGEDDEDEVEVCSVSSKPLSGRMSRRITPKTPPPPPPGAGTLPALPTATLPHPPPNQRPEGGGRGGESIGAGKAAVPRPPPTDSTANSTGVRNRRQVAFVERHSYLHPPLHCKMPTPGTPYTARSRTTAQNFPSPPDMRQATPRFNRSWEPADTPTPTTATCRATSSCSTRNGRHTSSSLGYYSSTTSTTATPADKEGFTPTATTLTFCDSTSISKQTVRVKDPELSEQIWVDQQRLFSRMAQNYTLMFQSLSTDLKDLILKHFPYVFAHTLYLSFYRTLPYFRGMMGLEFREYLLRNVSYWVTGVELRNMSVLEKRHKSQSPQQQKKRKKKYNNNDKESSEREASVLRQKLQQFEEREKKKREREFQRTLKKRTELIAQQQKRDAYMRKPNSKKSAQVLSPTEVDIIQQHKQQQTKSVTIADGCATITEEGEGVLGGGGGGSSSSGDGLMSRVGTGRSLAGTRGVSRVIKQRDREEEHQPITGLSVAPSSANLGLSGLRGSFWHNPKLSLQSLKQLGLEKKESHFINSVKVVGAFRSTIKDNELHNELEGFRDFFSKMKLGDKEGSKAPFLQTQSDESLTDTEEGQQAQHHSEAQTKVEGRAFGGTTSSGSGNPQNTSGSGGAGGEVGGRALLLPSSSTEKEICNSKVDTTNYSPSCRVWYESGKRNNQVYFSHGFHPDFNLTSSSPLIAQYLHDWGVYQNFMAQDIKWSIPP